RAKMSVMLLVLNEKLRENIRERMSGVYMIQAMPRLEWLPYQHYTLSILMTCDPERVDELSAAIFATVDSVRTGQFEERYVSSAKAVMQKSHEEFISQNRYWLSNVVNDALNDDELGSFLDNPSRYARIDKKAVTKAAKKYLSFDKDSLTVIMTPMEN
ncbi:MAG: insulinase family protein, partial [Candidatus Cloacimonadaceae bacterium]